MDVSNKEKFNKIIEKIKNSNTIVIVEGKKDRAALGSMGISNITELTKKPLYQIVEDIFNSNNECVILTDLDKKGREIYGKLSSDLQKRGIKINNNLRDFLFKNTKLRQIEGLASYMENNSL